MSRAKKQKEVEYIVTARKRGYRERFALTFPGCLDFITELLPQIERDPDYSGFTNFRINRYDRSLRMWNPPHVYKV